MIGYGSLDRGNKMLAPFRFRQIRHRAVVEAVQDRRCAWSRR